MQARRKKRSRSVTKLFIGLFLVAIIVALLAGGYFVVKDPSSKRRAFWALTLRVSLQGLLLLFLILAFVMGWIRPHGVGN
jgi:hypothetical protein